MLNIESAIVMLYEKYKRAKEYGLEKPISYALYNTWQYFEKIENGPLLNH